MLFALEQGSQTRGPRKGPIPLKTDGKTKIFKETLGYFAIFSKKTLFSLFFKLPERPYFESHVARESLWVWDPCFRMIILYQGKWKLFLMLECFFRVWWYCKRKKVSPIFFHSPNWFASRTSSDGLLGKGRESNDWNDIKTSNDTWACLASFVVFNFMTIL